MLASTPDSSPLSIEQYLELEKSSPIKHEFIDGRVFAMAGATDAHVTISLNLAVDLRNHLRGSPCRVFISDMKVWPRSLQRFFCPDVLVTCDPRDQELLLYKQHPKLIVEVLSESTEAYDRGDKFFDYQQIETLEEYCLVSTSQPRIDCFRKTEAGLWLLQSYLQGEFDLKSVNFTGKIEDLYADVNFTPLI